jgi:hypothetical protein
MFPEISTQEGKMATLNGKKLDDLKVTELKAELTARGISPIPARKASLVEKLTEVLQEEQKKKSEPVVAVAETKKIEEKVVSYNNGGTPAAVVQKTSESKSEPAPQKDAEKKELSEIDKKKLRASRFQIPEQISEEDKKKQRSLRFGGNTEPNLEKPKVFTFHK